MLLSQLVKCISSSFNTSVSTSMSSCSGFFSMLVFALSRWQHRFKQQGWRVSVFLSSANVVERPKNNKQTNKQKHQLTPQNIVLVTKSDVSNLSVIATVRVGTKFIPGNFHLDRSIMCLLGMTSRVRPPSKSHSLLRQWWLGDPAWVREGDFFVGQHVIRVCYAINRKKNSFMNWWN